MKPKASFPSFLAAIGGSVLAISSASAATYSWSDSVNGTAVSANWSAGGTPWGGVAPVSNASTTLNFTMTFGSNSTAETNTLSNDVANPFLLNVLTFTAAPTAANGSSVATVNIAGSALNFVNNVAVAPVVNLNANRSNGQLVTYNVQNNVTLGNNLTFQGNGTATFNFSGIISGSGFGITKSGTSTLALSGANDYTGGTSINAGTLTINSAGTLGQNLNTNNVSLAAGTRLNLSAAGNTGANQTITLTSTAVSLATLGIGYNGIPAATIAQADTNGGLIAINSVTGYNQNLSTLLTGKNLFLGVIGTSTFTGAAGTIVAGNSSTYRLGGGGGSISFNTANLFTGANAVQIGSTATGGTGTVIMGAAQDYTGATTLTAGTLSVSAANRLGGAAADLVFDGGTLQVTGTALTSLTSLGRTNPIVFNATKTVGLDIADAANTFTVGQVLNQTTGGFTKSGAGTAILDQNNTFTGGVTVGAGTLVLSGDNAIAGAVNLNAGTLQLAHINAVDTATGITALVGTTLNLRSNTAATFATPLTTFSNPSSGTLIIDVNRVSGSSTGNQLVLNGGLFSNQSNHGNESNINFTGGNGYTLSIPTLSISRAGGGGGGGGLHLNANSTSVAIGAATLNSTQAFFVDLAGTTTGNTMGAMDQVTGTFSLRKSGAGTWRVNGSSDFTGTTTISGGILEVEVMASGGSNSGVGKSSNAANQLLLSNGTTLRYVGAAIATTDRAFTINGTAAGHGATIESSGAGTLSFSGGPALAYGTTAQTRTLTLGGTNTGANTFGKVIADNTGATNATSLVKTGAGAWTLSVLNTYSGGTTIGNNSQNVGTLNITHGSALGTGPVSIVSNAGTGNFAALTLNSATGITVGNNFTTSGEGQGGNGIIRNVTGNNEISGTITLTSGGGSTRIQSDGGSLTLSNTIAPNTTGRVLVLSGSATGTVSGAINDGAGANTLAGLTKEGAGTWTLSGSNNYTGTTKVNGGTLKLGAGNVLPDTTNVTIGSATLDADTFDDTAGTLDAAGSAVINLGSGAEIAFANSSAVDWTDIPGTLNITGTLAATSLRFGTDNTGLSGPQLALISVNGAGTGTYVLDSSGYLVVGGGDVTAPTLTSIVDDKSGGPVQQGTVVTYTVTFNEDMASGTLDALDLDNDGSSAISIGTITQPSPKVFSVPVTPTSAGTLKLRIKTGALVEDLALNDLVVPVSDDTTITVKTPYDFWSGGAAFDDDANGDGVKNGLAFLLGATDKNVSALNLLPTVTQSGGALILDFSMLNAASRGTATLSLEHSGDLGDSDPWTAVLVPDADGGPTSGVTFTVIPGSPKNTVTATISSSEALSGKLFGRLEAVNP